MPTALKPRNFVPEENALFITRQKMKQILRNILHPGAYPHHINTMLFVLRLVAGIFMLTHGIGKMQTLIGSEPIQFRDPLGVGATLSLALAVFSEVFCSILLIAGFGTRLVTIPLLFTMIVASFVVHIDDGFGKQELPFLYAMVYLVIATMGAGKYSADYLLLKNKMIKIKINRHLSQLKLEK